MRNRSFRFIVCFMTILSMVLMPLMSLQAERIPWADDLEESPEEAAATDVNEEVTVEEVTTLEEVTEDVSTEEVTEDVTTEEMTSEEASEEASEDVITIDGVFGDTNTDKSPVILKNETDLVFNSATIIEITESNELESSELLEERILDVQKIYNVFIDFKADNRYVLKLKVNDTVYYVCLMDYFSSDMTKVCSIKKVDDVCYLEYTSSSGEIMNTLAETEGYVEALENDATEEATEEETTEEITTEEVTTEEEVTEEVTTEEEVTEEEVTEEEVTEEEVTEEVTTEESTEEVTEEEEIINNAGIMDADPYTPYYYIDKFNVSSVSSKAKSGPVFEKVTKYLGASVPVYVGSVIRYGGTCTNYFSTVANPNSYNNNVYCINPSKGTPPNGATFGSQEITNEIVRKVTYYTFGAPGFLESTGFYTNNCAPFGGGTADNFIIMNHLVLSYAMCATGTEGYDANWNLGLSPAQETAIGTLYNNIVGSCSPLDAPNFHVYLLETGGGSYQNMLTWEDQTQIYLQLSKAIADSNYNPATVPASAPSTAGAQYRLTHGVTGNTICTFTIGADGLSDTFIVPEGRYYLQETVAPAGYQLDTTVYRLEIASDGSYQIYADTPTDTTILATQQGPIHMPSKVLDVVSVVEKIQPGVGEITINKWFSGYSGNNIAYDNVYNYNYDEVWFGLYSDSSCTTVAVNAAGYEVNFDSPSPSHNHNPGGSPVCSFTFAGIYKDEVASSVMHKNIYYAKYIATDLSSGTYYVKETKSPVDMKMGQLSVNGSTWSNVASVTINTDDDNVDTTNNIAYIAANDELYTGAIKIQKEGKGSVSTSGNSAYDLNGAEFTVYTNEACTSVAKDKYGNNVVLTIGGTNHEASHSDMWKGIYWINETKAPKGYTDQVEFWNGSSWVSGPYKFSITDADIANGVINNISLRARNPEATGSVKLSKNGSDGGSVAGAEFTVYYYTTSSARETAVNNKSASSGTSKGTFVIDTTGTGMCGASNTISNLPIGYYLIVETKKPTSGNYYNSYGWTKDGNDPAYKGPIKFEITEAEVKNNASYTETFTATDSSKGSVSIKKYSDGVIPLDERYYSLVGAEFALKKGNATVCTFEIVKQGNEYIGKIISSNSAYTTALVGDTVATGLDYDTYSIEETVAPAGHTKDDVTFEINGVTTASNPVSFEVSESTSNIVVKATDKSVIPCVYVKKASSKPACSSSPLYSLAGAEYTFYLEIGCINVAKTVSGADAVVTTDAQGKSNVIEMKPGVYYVKETKAPKGYKLRDGYTRIEITGVNTPDNPYVVNVTDEPGFDPIHIMLNKNNNANLPLQGAVYCVEFYDSIQTTDFSIINQNTPARKWYVVTDASGNAYMDAAHLAPGYTSAAFYSVNAQGHAEFPLGTVVVYEEKAPVGYTKDNTKHANYLVMDRTFNDVQWITGGDWFEISSSNAPVVSDAPIPIKLTVRKHDNNNTPAQGNTGDCTLKGAVFGLYAKRDIVDVAANAVAQTASAIATTDTALTFADGTPVIDNNTGKQVVVKAGDALPIAIFNPTDANGETTLDNLVAAKYADDYYVKELVAPKGYYKDNTVHEVDLRDDRTDQQRSDASIVVWEKSLDISNRSIMQPLKIKKYAQVLEGQNTVIKPVNDIQFEVYLVKDLAHLNDPGVVIDNGNGTISYNFDRYDFSDDTPVIVTNDGRRYLTTGDDGDDGEVTSIPLYPGVYVVVESVTPPSLKPISPMVVEMPKYKTDANGNMLVDAFEDPIIYATNSISPLNYEVIQYLKINKRDAINDNFVFDNPATFQIYNVTGTDTGNYVNDPSTYGNLVTQQRPTDEGFVTVDKFKTTNNGYLMLYDAFKYGEYAIVETEAPEGYDLAEPVFFSVRSDAVYLWINNSWVKANKYTNTTANATYVYWEAEVFDEPFSLEVAKVDSETGDFVPDATLVIYKALDEEGHLAVGANGDPVPLMARDAFTGLTIPAMWNTMDSFRRFEAIPSGWYVIRELDTPDGYATIKDLVIYVGNDNTSNTPGTRVITGEETIYYSFNERTGGVDFVDTDTVRVDTKKTEVILPDKPITVEVSKIDASNQEELPGAELTLYKVDDNGTETEIESWISSTTPHVVKYLEVGNYKLVEDTTPLGFYNTKNFVEFEVTDTEVIQHCTMENYPTITVDISKRDSATEEELPGAVLSLYKVENESETLIETWTSTTESHVIKGLLPGKYKLVEDTVPLGYYTENNTIEFELTAEDNGKLVKQIMYNHTTIKVAISKRDSATEEELPGAVLSLYKISTDGETLIETWTSTDESHVVEGLTPGKYKLVEDSIPLGYYTENNTIEFELTSADNGKLVKQIMYNHPRIKVAVSKIDATSEKELAGAKLSLYKIEDTVEELIETWTSTNESHVVENLLPGKYKLVEDASPLGYYFTEDESTIEFELTSADNGKVVKQYMKNHPIVVKVDKKSVDLDSPVSGATLAVVRTSIGPWCTPEYYETVKDYLEAADFDIPEDTKLVDYWVTDGTTKELVGLFPGNYRVIEVKTPSGYTTSESIDFTVSDDVPTQNLVLYDEPIKCKIVIHKTGTALLGTENTSCEYGDYTKFVWSDTVMENVSFVVTDEDGEKIATITTDSTGTATLDNLEFGVYKIREIVPEGWIDRSIEYTVTFTWEEGITEKEIVADVDVHNDSTDTQVNVFKVAEFASIVNGKIEYNTNPLKGVLFAVYSAEDIKDYRGNLLVGADTCLGYAVTNSEGVASFNERLVKAKYYFKEIKSAGPQYVVDSSKLNFSVETGTKALSVVNVNKDNPHLNKSVRGNISVYKYDKNTLAPLAGAEFDVYGCNGEIVDHLTTDETGYAETITLPYGEYTIVETKAPEGYQLSETPYKAVISEDEEIVYVKISNQTPPPLGSFMFVKYLIIAIALSLIVTFVIIRGRKHKM